MSMMIKDKKLKVGDLVYFQYVKRDRDYNYYPVTVNYEVQDIVGTIIHIRDCNVDKLGYKTVRDKPEIERSRYVVTVKQKLGGIGKYYDGRMINIKVDHSIARKIGSLIAKQENEIIAQITDLSNQEK